MKKYTFLAFASFYFCMSVNAKSINLHTDSVYGSETNVLTTKGVMNGLSATIKTTGLTGSSDFVYEKVKDANGIGKTDGNQGFTMVENSVLIGNTPAIFCRNSNFNIPITIFGIYNIGNVFTVELLNSSNVVVQTLGTLTQSGTVVANILNSIPLGDYKIRVTSSNPVLTTSPTVPITITGVCLCVLNYSLASGNWGTAETWSCGHVPLVSDPVQISSGHTVTLNVNGVGKSLNLVGILKQQTSKILTIQGY